MSFAAIYVFFALGPSAAPGTAPDPKAQMLQMVGTFVFMGVVMYFLMFRPQQKKTQEHNRLLKALKTGDKVVTQGGVLGVVINVKEKSVSIRSADTKLEVLKSAVSEILEKSSAVVE